MELIKTQPTLEKDVALVGSWTVNVGDQDQALHLWQYTGGFAKIDEASEILGKNQVGIRNCLISTFQLFRFRIGNRF